MSLKKEESFYAMFYILDNVYNYESRDDLGAILGVINPELTKDCTPADIAVYYDWKDFILDKSINKKNIINYIEKFLTWYSETYGLDFNLSLNVLADKIEEPIVEECIEKATYSCKKYNINFD